MDMHEEDSDGPSASAPTDCALLRIRDCRFSRIVENLRAARFFPMVVVMVFHDHERSADLR